MEILAVIIFVVIVFTIAFIAYAYHWLSKRQSGYSPFFAPIPEPIIKTYNMEEMYYSFRYTTPAGRMKMYEANPLQAKTLTVDALAYEKKRVAEKIGRKMLEDGFIEVNERMDRDDTFMNEVTMRARVYKDESVLYKKGFDKGYEQGIDSANEAHAVWNDPNW